MPSPIRGDTSEADAGFASLREAQVEAARCLKCPDPTCVWGCPARNDIPGFMAALERGDLEDAYRIISLTSIFPGICSRVCDKAAQCEGACTLAIADNDPIAIGLIERFIADSMAARPEYPAILRSPAHVDLADGDGMSVAVVGGGPAGIAAAWWLAKSGVFVDLFEADHVLGGVLAWGIPSYTLPSATATAPIDLLLSFSRVRVTTEFTVGKDAKVDELLESYDAVVLAHGASLPPRLDIPGSSLAGVDNAKAFLERSRGWLFGQEVYSMGRVWESAGKHDRRGVDGGKDEGIAQERGPIGRILVIGGGDTAMAVCRTAARLGMQAVSVRRRAEGSARVRHDEVAKARAEGVEIRFGISVKCLEGLAGAVETARLLIRDTRRHHLLKRAALTLEALAVDQVVIATGFTVDQSVTDQSVGLGAQQIGEPGSPLLRSDRGGAFEAASRSVDRDKIPPLPLQDRPPLVGKLGTVLSAGGMLDKGSTAHAIHDILEREIGLELARHPVVDRCWVVGDALVGPSSVVEAMAEGREAAMSILSAEPLRRPSTISRARTSREHRL
ncbi:MAG: FAD-dependent oxidoreductase [Acidimicrobiales bacterium]